ncbi:hypothetical protein GCM10017771_88980 [Streptomyces capitiformicae]|uniref:Uncharacterized protein n=1 Tax=Streptomyces capitiformicae TaxID=2014920 RepID=A0A918ZR14_9ACTN|nr:hypothetical protein GCM10017771_88980 [Streptomyces capitiformicae]
MVMGGDLADVRLWAGELDVLHERFVTATVLVLIAGQISGTVSASFVVADAGLVLASSSPL